MTQTFMHSHELETVWHTISKTARLFRTLALVANAVQDFAGFEIY